MVSGEHLTRAWHFSSETGENWLNQDRRQGIIIGQRACMIAVAHSWHYIVDSSTVGDADGVVDV